MWDQYHRDAQENLAYCANLDKHFALQSAQQQNLVVSKTQTAATGVRVKKPPPLDQPRLQQIEILLRSLKHMESIEEIVSAVIAEISGAPVDSSEVHMWIVTLCHSSSICRLFSLATDRRELFQKNFRLIT